MKIGNYRISFPSITRCIFFTPLNETAPTEDVDDGNVIEGLTEADVEALEQLDLPRYEVESKKRMMERYGRKHPWEILRFPMSNYYSYRAFGDRRYLGLRKYNVKELAKLGFTYEFYEKMVLDLAKFFLEHPGEKEVKLIKRDLRSACDPRLKELAKRIMDR